jgi:Ca2+-binding RTX toxin-like protein
MFRLTGDEGALLGLLTGWDSGSNPFGEFLRLRQVGSDTLLEWDRDGAAGGSGWETLVVFQDTSVGDFTNANFDPAYDPGGDVPAGETITGTNDADSLTGTIGNDIINALGGDDNVSGLAGADQINGGDGFDNLFGDAGDDVIDGGNDGDQVSGGDGNDQLFGQAGDDIVSGDAGNDQVSGGDGSDFLSGDDGNDIISGGNDDDFLVGADGNDVLSGGLGSDVLVGGTGADILDFQSASQGPDQIIEFVSGTDQIRISASGFGGGLTAGGSVSLVSGSDPTANSASGQFLFDTDDGSLFWDADGTGAGGAVLIATLSDAPPLTSTDFVVVV